MAVWKTSFDLPTVDDDRRIDPTPHTHACSEHNDWEQLNATLTLISKRRQQNKAAITAVVQEAMTYVEQAPGKEAKRALITTLRDITGASDVGGQWMIGSSGNVEAGGGRRLPCRS